MGSAHNISDAGIYTDFNGLQRLRSKVTSPENSAESQQATKEVAKQFESLFLQMMLKSMRDATVTGDSTESDQTRFYQEMFDKQIALDLSNNEKGHGLGIATMLEKNMAGNKQQSLDSQSVADDFELIRSQINRPGASIQPQHITEQE